MVIEAKMPDDKYDEQASRDAEIWNISMFLLHDRLTLIHHGSLFAFDDLAYTHNLALLARAS